MGMGESKLRFDQPDGVTLGPSHSGGSHVVVHVVIRGFETVRNRSHGTLDAANRSQNPRKRSRWMGPPRVRDREAPGSNPGPPTNSLNSDSSSCARVWLDFRGLTVFSCARLISPDSPDALYVVLGVLNRETTLLETRSYRWPALSTAHSAGCTGTPGEPWTLSSSADPASLILRQSRSRIAQDGLARR